MPSEQPVDDLAVAKAVELQRVITVRLPASLHQQLKDEAKQLSLKLGDDVSMNRLCVWKLKEPL